MNNTKQELTGVIERFNKMIDDNCKGENYNHDFLIAVDLSRSFLLLELTRRERAIRETISNPSYSQDEVNRMLERREGELLFEIKEKIKKRMKVMPRPSIEQWNDNLTEGTTYITGVELMELFNSFSPPVRE